MLSRIQQGQPERGNTMCRRIAVVGAGAAGLAAAWALSKDHDVHLFESADRLGGHAHTVDLEVEGVNVPVDTGFIVFNDVNYPSLTAAFDTLGVATQESDMSFSVSTNGGRFEYSGRWPGGVLAQKKNLMSPTYWRMLRDIRRFYTRAAGTLAEVESAQFTLADYIAWSGYGRAFRDRHLLPMVAAIWSLPTGDAENMPAAAVIRFFEAHGLLRLRHRPQWRTVRGGSRSYVDRIIADMDATIHAGRPVKAITRQPDGVILSVPGIGPLEFDDVVVATHGDQALKLLRAPFGAETQVLGAFKYSANRAVLHGDRRLMPRRRAAWASWNFIETPDGRQGVSYWMNLLQNLRTQEPVLVTLNPPMDPDPLLTFGIFAYDHPVFDQGAISAQRGLDALQGRDHTWFCGSYFGYGFHEDAFASGLRAAALLDASIAPRESVRHGQWEGQAHA
jgi:predicted NAD/FAD-binding protein